MKITVVGTGYVGLVSGACFSDVGIEVTCVDVDKKKIEDLKKEIISLPVYTWGTEKREWNPQNLSLDDFSSYYFGSVTAG